MTSPSYPTLDYLPDLTSAQMANAGTLTLVPATANTLGWDFQASYFSSAPYALLRDTFRFAALEGATYDIISSSYFDPFLIQVYDQFGNVVKVSLTDPDGGSYGYDFVVDWVAPYTGTFYVSAGWNQGSFYRDVGLLVGEDRDTIPTIPVVHGSMLDNVLVGTLASEEFRAWDGNDVMTGGGGNDTLLGGDGIDTAVFSGARWDYIVPGGTSTTVTDTVANRDGADTLVSIERLDFADLDVALDLTGNAGNAAKVLGIVFGSSMVGNAAVAGIALGLADTMSYAALMDLALDMRLGPTPTNAAVVDLLYANLIGAPPPEATREYFVSWITSGSYTQTSLAMLAADVMGIPVPAQYGLMYL